MASSYYYLMSSLPLLKADGEMPFSYAKFLELCETCVSDASYRRLQELTVRSSEGPLIAEWAVFYRGLAQELAYQRNVRLGRPCETPLDSDEETARTVKAALNAANPLEAENLLLALEFDRLDGLIGTHSFDEYELNGYALKLKLLERQTVFDKAAGKTEFRRLLENIKQQISSI